MNEANRKIVEALEELDAIHKDIIRRAMSDEIEKVMPRLVGALKTVHQFLVENVPEKEMGDEG